ncbi:MAG: DEAD/DEAH box helicase, partial [Blastomonas fulva]
PYGDKKTNADRASFADKPRGPRSDGPRSDGPRSGGPGGGKPFAPRGDSRPRPEGKPRFDAKPRAGGPGKRPKG